MSYGQGEAASAESCMKSHSQRLQQTARTKGCIHLKHKNPASFSIHLKHKNPTVKGSQYIPKTLHQHKKYDKTYKYLFLWDLEIN